jgi:hypothetical protein
MVIKQKKLFVVGNSRSGTTMMGRILGRHPSVFTFQELHFFGQLWNPHIDSETLAFERAKKLVARLIDIQRDGYYTRGRPEHYMEEANNILKDLPQPLTPPHIFSAFLHYESVKNNATIPCDHTPRNLYHLQEILSLYPNAYAINMIRDPRDVLLSQKNKWRRRFLGASDMPIRELIRSWTNYHPITISMLWNSAIRAGDKLLEHSRVFHLRFEDLINKPERYVNEICSFFGLDYRPEMILVPQVGSSHRPDQPHKLGIDQSAAGRWRQDCSNTTDLALCQWVTEENMLLKGYAPANFKINLPDLIVTGAVLPIKTSMAFLLNLKRARSLIEFIKTRLRG